MVNLLNWDTDGDGDISMDELREHVSSLGYTFKEKGRSAFKNKGERGFI